MASRKSFLVYKDIDVEGMDDNQLGQLFRAMLNFANGEEVTISDPETRGLWRSVKRQMKEDAESYDGVVNARAKAGKAGAEKRWGSHGKDTPAKSEIANMANAIPAKSEIANMADTDTDTDTDTDIPPKAPQQQSRPIPFGYQMSNNDPGFDDAAIASEFNDKELGEKFVTWLHNRASMNGSFPYGSQVEAITQAEAAEVRYGAERCKELISRAIAAGWKGIPWESLEKKPETTRSGTTPKKSGWAPAEQNQYDFDAIEKALGV